MRPVKHVHERWQAEHGGTRSYTWTKKTLQAAGQVVRAPAILIVAEQPGMMLHQDGSTHAWVPGCQWDLMVTVDDATTEIYSAFFVEEEGTLSSLQGLREVIGTKGLFSSLYTDRGSHYWYTEEAGGKVDQTRLTQVHRALQQMGITLIPAYSPEARGRSERVFRTLQDRLPKELALAGITEMAAANRYLVERFLPAYNRRLPCRLPKSARPLSRGRGLTSPIGSAFKRTASWPTTIPYAIRGRCCRFLKTRIGFSEGHGPDSCVSGWDPGRVPWSPVFGALPRG